VVFDSLYSHALSLLRPGFVEAALEHSFTSFLAYTPVAKLVIPPYASLYEEVMACRCSFLTMSWIPVGKSRNREGAQITSRPAPHTTAGTTASGGSGASRHSARCASAPRRQLGRRGVPPLPPAELLAVAALGVRSSRKSTQIHTSPRTAHPPGRLTPPAPAPPTPSVRPLVPPGGRGNASGPAASRSLHRALLAGVAAGSPAPATPGA